MKVGKNIQCSLQQGDNGSDIQMTVNNNKTGLNVESDEMALYNKISCFSPFATFCFIFQIIL